MKIGFIAGTFDVIHPGYIKMFKEAYDNCDYLVIGLHDNPKLERAEKLEPILSYEERYEILSSIKYIGRIYKYTTESELVDLLKEVKPTIRFLGDDYIGKKITGEDLNIEFYYLNRSHGWSATKYKKLIHKQLNNDFSTEC
jgi:glycerol-3-phosphate cytidylyltransferase